MCELEILSHEVFRHDLQKFSPTKCSDTIYRNSLPRSVPTRSTEILSHEVFRHDLDFPRVFSCFGVVEILSHEVFRHDLQKFSPTKCSDTIYRNSLPRSVPTRSTEILSHEVFRHDLQKRLKVRYLVSHSRLFWEEKVLTRSERRFSHPSVDFLVVLLKGQLARTVLCGRGPRPQTLIRSGALNRHDATTSPRGLVSSDNIYLCCLSLIRNELV
ncbi:hypothetical protein J6590_057737 [Homalodisca vitripennis]|nr:hypothetical protein J6590_057737 [Homalodisca vitripennis]